MTIYILFFVLLVCSMCMFIFLNRRISILSKKSPVTSSEIEKDMSEVVLQIDVLKEKVSAVEMFSSDVNRETFKKAEEIRTIRDDLNHNYDQWNEIYGKFNEMVIELNKKQNNYDELVEAIDIAEQHSNDLRNEISTFESLKENSLELKENIGAALQDFKEEKKNVVHELQIARDGFDNEIELYKEKAVHVIQHEIEVMKIKELKKVEHELDSMYKVWEQQHTDMVQRMKQELQIMHDKVDDLHSMSETHVGKNTLRMQEEASRIAQEIDNDFMDYKGNIKNLIVESNENYNKIKEQYQEAYDTVLLLANQGMENFEAKLREKKESVYIFVEGQIERINHAGESSFTHLTTQINDKKLTIEDQVHELMNVTDTEISRISKDTTERMYAIESMSKEQYDSFVRTMNELAQASKAVEEKSIQSSQELQEHIDAVSHKLDNDYEQLSKEKDMLQGELQEIQRQYDRIETQVHEQLSAEFEGHASNMKKHLNDVIVEVNKASGQHMNEMKVLFNQAKEQNKHDLQNIKDNYIQTLNEQSSEFQTSFEDYKTVLWSEIELYKNSIDILKGDLDDELTQQKEFLQNEINEQKTHLHEDIAKFKDTVASILEESDGNVHEKIGMLNKELESYDHKIKESLKKASDEEEVKYLERLQKHNEGFDEEIKQISVKLQKLQDDNAFYQEKMNEEFYNIRKDAEEKRGDYEKFLKSIEERNTDLSRELEKANERYNDYTKKHKILDERMHELKKEKEVISKQMIEVESFKATLSTMRKEYHEVKKELEMTSKSLSTEKNRLKDALSNYKVSSKALGKLEDKISKTSHDMKMLEQQGDNINDIKTKLAEIREFQQKVKAQQSELNNWDRDYKMIHETITGLLNRNNEIEKKTLGVENQFKSWQFKIDSTNKSFGVIDGKLSKLEVFHNEIEDFEKKMPDIQNNLEEYKEMQSSLSDKEASFKDTLTKADQVIQTLGVLHSKNNKEISNDKLSASKPEMKKTVLNLYQSGWKEENISEALKITIDEVKLILQKSAFV